MLMYLFVLDCHRADGKCGNESENSLRCIQTSIIISITIWMCLEMLVYLLCSIFGWLSCCYDYIIVFILVCTLTVSIMQSMLMWWSRAPTRLFGHSLWRSFFRLILLCIFLGQLCFEDETDRNYTSILKCTRVPTAHFMTIFQLYAFASITVIKRLIKNPVKISHQRLISIAVQLTAFGRRQIPKCATVKLCNIIYRVKS